MGKMSKRKYIRLTAATGLIAMATFAPFTVASPASAAAGLCAANSDYADEDWITNLQLGSGTAITGEQGVTYQDATGTSVGTFAAGSTNNQITATVNIDMSTADPGDIWPEHVFIWLDLNQDGVVDLNTESIYSEEVTSDLFTVPDQSAPNAKTHTYTGTFSIPRTAYNGTVIGRAMLQWVPTGEQPILCNSDSNAYDQGNSAFEAGTVIDFKANITGGVNNPTLANTGSDNTMAIALGSTLLLGGAALIAVGNRRRAL